jgi:hypothetical protein
MAFPGACSLLCRPAMSLIDSLVQQFGINQGQAQGAVGAIVRLAQGKLAPEHLSELGRLIPGLDGMMASAPQGGGGGFLGGLGSMMGGSLGQAAQLAGIFGKLGIPTGLIGPIAMAVLAWVQANGSDGLKQTLAQLAASLGVKA